MPVTQDRLTRLREFGLSEYAARSYLALLDLGIAEARDVSSISKVPQAKIYHVLEQLHDKGLVVILPEFPKKYAPVPFEEYLGRLYDEHKKAAEAIESEREALAEMFRVMGDTEVGDRGFFTVIRGRRNVLAKIEEMVAQTQKDLVVLGTEGTATRAASMLPELKRARGRDVRVRMLLPVQESTIEALLPIADVAELRARDLGEEEQSGKVAIVVSDSARAFLIHFVPDDANLYHGKDIGVFTDQEAMVAAIQAIVEPHFQRATTYESRREQIVDGVAPEFTRVYASREESDAALVAALARGAREVLVMSGAEVTAHTVKERERMRELRGAAKDWRVILNFRDVAAIDDTLATAGDDEGVQLRHLSAPAAVSQLVVDAREAFFTVGGTVARGGAEVVIHTNSAPIVRALREHFDRVWSASAHVADRRRELEVFPGLQPADVGLGHLFHLIEDAVVVLDERHRVVLWNPGASAVLGRDPRKVVGTAVGELFDGDGLADALERVHADGDAAQETLQARAVHEDGRAVPVDVTLSRLPSAGGSHYAVLVARDLSARSGQTEKLEAR